MVVVEEERGGHVGAASDGEQSDIIIFDTFQFKSHAVRPLEAVDVRLRAPSHAPPATGRCDVRALQLA